MKKLFLPLLLILMLPITYSCSTSRLANYRLTEADATAAVREMLSLGARDGSLAGAFSKEKILSTIFPESLTKTLNTLNQLGLTGEIDRFTNTLSLAAEKTATRSVPIFVSSITNMRVGDAINLIKSGNGAATSYLRQSVGDTLRQSIKPVMQEAMDEYKLGQQWENLIKPIRGLTGNRLNLDLANLMAGMVSEAMFRKIEAKEAEIRSNAAARTTPLLKKVFSRNWD